MKDDEDIFEPLPLEETEEFVIYKEDGTTDTYLIRSIDEGRGRLIRAANNEQRGNDV